jgi:hypothetical protein
VVLEARPKSDSYLIRALAGKGEWVHTEKLFPQRVPYDPDEEDDASDSDEPEFRPDDNATGDAATSESRGRDTDVATERAPRAPRSLRSPAPPAAAPLLSAAEKQRLAVRASRQELVASLNNFLAEIGQRSPQDAAKRLVPGLLTIIDAFAHANECKALVRKARDASTVAQLRDFVEGWKRDTELLIQQGDARPEAALFERGGDVGHSPQRDATTPPAAESSETAAVSGAASSETSAATPSPSAGESPVSPGGAPATPTPPRRQPHRRGKRGKK